MRYFSLQSQVIPANNQHHEVWFCRGENVGGSELAPLPAW